MRVIAEFTMRSRGHALGVALAGTLLPLMQWVSCGAIGVVTLRHGMREGAFVLIVVLAPQLLVFAASASPNLLAILVPLQTAVLAGVLRQSRSWELTVCCAPVLGIAMILLTQLIAAPAIEKPLEVAAALAQQDLDVNPAAYSMILALMTFFMSLTATAFVCLGRWWQSVLFNPGGFATEFRGLRLSPAIMAGTVLIALVGVGIGGVFTWWFLPLIVPIVFASAGLLHFIVDQRGLSSGPLVAYYVTLALGLVTILPLPFLLLPAVLDSIFDLRGRLTKPNND